MYILVTIAIVCIVVFVLPALILKRKKAVVKSGEHVFLNKKYYHKYPLDVRKNVLTIEEINSEEATVAYYDISSQKIVRTKVDRSELIAGA